MYSNIKEEGLHSERRLETATFREVKWRRVRNSLIHSSHIRSNRSGQMSECERFAQVTQDKWMSDCERIAQVAHDKWSNVTDSLRSLRTNERLARFFEKIAHFLLRSQKMSSSLKKLEKIVFLVCFLQFFLKFLKKQIIRSFLLRSLRTNERP